MSPRAWPMRVRVFALIAATLVAVQLANLALLWAVPGPPPRLQSLARIDAVLRGAPARADEVVELWTRLPPGPRDERDLALQRRVAAALRVPADAVRARLEGAPAGAIGGLYERSTRPELADVVAGPAIVAVRLPDGRWRSVRPDGGWWTAWWWRSAGLMLVAALTVSIPAWLLARRLARPLQLFADAARRVGRDPRAEPVALAGPAELAQAVDAVNEMQRQVHAYVAERVMIVGAIAHDLRTPLMRIAMRLEHAPADQRAAAEADMRELQGRLDAALRFVRGLSAPVAAQRLDLRSVVESVVADVADLGHAVTLSDGPPVVVSGDGPALKAAVANLVENACRYADGAEVTLDVGEMAVVRVADRGPGLPPDDLARAFEPFFRGERSRNRDTGGIGLGLATVRATAQAHGGDATLGPRDGGGLVAELRLPV